MGGYGNVMTTNIRELDLWLVAVISDGSTDTCRGWTCIVLRIWS